MQLLDLPIEVFRLVIADPVRELGLTESMRARLTSRLFAREILDAVIATKTIEDISHSGLGIMRYQYNILARYIHHRISARGPVLHGWIPHIRLTVQKLLRLKGQGSSVSHEELEWEACASKAAVEGAHAILFMRTDERPISKVENDTEEDCLALAAWIGDFDLVKSLHKGTNPETFFGTPSWAAARRGHVEIVRYCLEHRAELTPTDGLMTSIGPAASMGHEKVVQLYLDLPEFNVEGRPDVISAVHRAAKENQVTTYKMLLAHAKRVDTHYNYVKALDHSFVYACKRGALDTAKLALEYGANIEQTDAGPRNCLQNAAISGNVELVKMLLERGASVFPAEEINYRSLRRYIADKKRPDAYREARRRNFTQIMRLIEDKKSELVLDYYSSFLLYLHS